MRSSLAQIDHNAIAEATAAGRFGPAALERRVKEVREHYERICERRADYIAKNAYYYEQVFQLLRFIIPPGKRILQVGCLTPDFLHVVAPSFGVGIAARGFLDPGQELLRQRVCGGLHGGKLNTPAPCR